MNSELLRRVAEVTKESYFRHTQNPTQEQFLIRQRHMSELTLGKESSAVTISVHPRFEAFPEHEHDFVEMMYVCSGQVKHIVNGQPVTLNVGDVLVLGRGSRHAICMTEEQDIGLNLIISIDFFESLLPRLRQMSSFPDTLFDRLLDGRENSFAVFRTNEVLPIENLMESLIYSVVNEKMTDSFVLQQSLSLLLAYLADSPEILHTETVRNTYEERLRRRLAEYLRNAYRSATLEEASTLLGFSPSYLCRWIRQHQNTTFKALLADERFSVAQKLLLNTDYSVEAIIEHVGYENRSYFHKQFRQRFGTTPKRYRTENRE